MNGGYSQYSRVLITTAKQAHKSHPNRRTSSDSVWPLRRSDGTKLYERKDNVS